MSTIERLLLAIVIVESLGLIGGQVWNFINHKHRQSIEELRLSYDTNLSTLRFNYDSCLRDADYYKKAYYAVFAELEQFKQNKLKKSRTPSQSKDVPVTK